MRFLLLLLIISLLLLLLAQSITAGTVVLSWTQNPEVYEAVCDDVNPGNDIAGYKIYWGTSRAYDHIQDAGYVTTYTMTVPSGTWYFAITAYDACGNESSYSNEVVKVIQDVGIPTPTNLRFQ